MGLTKITKDEMALEAMALERCCVDRDGRPTLDPLKAVKMVVMTISAAYSKEIEELMERMKEHPNAIPYEFRYIVAPIDERRDEILKKEAELAMTIAAGLPEKQN